MPQSLCDRGTGLTSILGQRRWWRATRVLAAVLAAGVVGLSHVAIADLSLCGNGMIDPGEDCDLGGTCIGGPAAGVACRVGDSTCTSGTCTTFGGRGCAANCTFEQDITFPLTSGQLDGSHLVPGTSGLTIDGDGLTIPLPFGAACSATSCVPSQIVLTVGRPRDSRIPVVVRPRAVELYPGTVPSRRLFVRASMASPSEPAAVASSRRMERPCRRTARRGSLPVARRAVTAAASRVTDTRRALW
jgi:hypothetical protein